MSLFGIMDLQSSVGYLRVNYQQVSGGAGTKVRFNIGGTGEVIEGSIGACSTNNTPPNSTIYASLSSFKLIGKSGAEYDCINRYNKLYLSVGGNEIAIFEGGPSWQSLPLFAVGDDGSCCVEQWDAYNSNTADYDIVLTQVESNKPGYMVVTLKKYSGSISGTLFTPSGVYAALSDIIKGSRTVTNDPYGNGGESGAGGGGGSFDNTSTPIDIPNLPSISAASTGFISLFNPTLNQLNDLASYLWSDLFEIDGWKKLFADPMDAILGLSIVPVAVPSGGTREVKVGNIGTGKSLTIASSQFVEVDCGSIDVNEYWGAYLDYEPYTQAQIFLPYIGTRPISVDEIMGKTVRVVYHVDILTGACCCFVKCGDSVLYTYNGQCSIPIPITGANYASVVNGVISIAASVGSLVATGGSSAPTAIPAIASSAVNQMKPQVEKSGSISGSAGVLNMQTPYLILIRPRQALPSKQNEFIGYPSLITVQLTELSGYTEVQSIHLENIPATQEELAEIESLLKGGVIF